MYVKIYGKSIMLQCFNSFDISCINYGGKKDPTRPVTGTAVVGPSIKACGQGGMSRVNQPDDKPEIS